jgi:hypothetical protein
VSAPVIFSSVSLVFSGLLVVFTRISLGNLCPAHLLGRTHPSTLSSDPKDLPSLVMSGTEAIAVLSLIGTIIQIVDGTNQVYDAAKDAQGLPVAFREVQARLPTVKSLLVSVQTELWERRIDESVCKTARPLTSACEEQVRQLDYVFRKAIPAEGTSNLAQWYRAVRTTRNLTSANTIFQAISSHQSHLIPRSHQTYLLYTFHPYSPPILIPTPIIPPPDTPRHAPQIRLLPPISTIPTTPPALSLVLPIPFMLRKPPP